MSAELHRTYIALGSNLDNPLAQVNRAVAALAQLPETQLLQQSPWYQSAAIGPGEQPDYINGVVALATQLSPDVLLREIQRIEHTQGRERQIHWGARTLDLDILLYGDQVIATDQLQIPHPRLTQRNFVIYPLADIDPHLILPDGTAVAALKAQCSADGLIKLATSLPVG